MAAPSTAITRFDLSLAYAEFSLLANQRNFIGLKVLPPVGVGMQSADFLKVLVEALLTKVEDTERNPDGTYSESDYEWTKDSYATADHGVVERMDDRRIKIYGNEIRAEMIHTQRAYNRVLQAYENAVAAAVFNTSIWTGAELTTAASVAWTTASSAVPITDIDAAIEKVISSSGTRPNALVLTDYALLKLARTAQVQDLLKYSSKDDPKALNAIPGIKELFMLDRVLVAKSVKNSADEGQTATFGRMWDPTMAMVCHIHESEDLEDPALRIGSTVMWTDENNALPGSDDSTMNLIVEEYRDDGSRSSKLRGRCDYQVKIIHPEAGHLITGVTA